MKIEDELFTINFDEEKKTIFFTGTLRLNTLEGFDKIKQFMTNIYLKYDQSIIELNFEELEFMNSAGISTLCKFIFQIKGLNGNPIKIVGNNKILWQKKSFANLKILWNDIELVFK